MLTKKPGASLLPTGEQCTASAAAARRATVAGPGDRGGGRGTSWRGGAGRYGGEPRVPASQPGRQPREEVEEFRWSLWILRPPRLIQLSLMW